MDRLKSSAETTEYYGLVKPKPDEFYDIAVGNQNLDQVDEALKGLADQKADQEGVYTVLAGMNADIEKVRLAAESAKGTAQAANTAIAAEVKSRTDADTSLQGALNTHAGDGVKHVSAAERTTWNAKAGTTTATASTSGLMAAADKVKLDGIAAQANKTVIANNLTTTTAGSALDAAQGKALNDASSTHAADGVKHITAAERTTWNAKAGTAAATSSASGLMTAADKAKLDGIAAQANKTVIANNLTTTTAGSALDAVQGKALNDASSAHAVDGIKHITAAERTTWNAKAGTAAATASTSGLMTAADKAKLDGIAAQANKTVIANNLTTTAAGSALDAAQGKVIGDRLGGLEADMPKVTSVEITLTAAGWNASTKIQTVVVAGVTVTANGSIGLANTATDEQALAAAKAGIRITGQSGGSITVKCSGVVPTVNIPVAVVIIN